jgi:aspartate-semialdehyde dehydrogenase
MALAPLHRAIGIRRIVVSTYQSVSGSGWKGINQLMNERVGKDGENVYPHKIDLNLFPHGGDFLENAYTTEEMKLVNETRKILSDNKLAITSTVVRVPVKGGHSESVNIEFRRGFMLDEITKLLGVVPGLIILDVPTHNLYPTPLMVEGRDEVFVGRIRLDESQPNSLNLWIVADNLRKGAATNAVQIAKYLIQKEFVKS